MGYNSTIITKKKQLKCGCFDYNFSKGMCRTHATIESTNKRLSEHEDTIEEESIKNLIEDLDVVFSRYIRLKNSDKEGNTICCTCGSKQHYTETDAGHYIPRANLSTRWNEHNVSAQCKPCNRLEYGKQKEFEAYIEKNHKGMVEYLKELSKQIYKPDRQELKGLIAEYRFKLKLIKK